jgi:ABC-2 type transport system ATP-binding protein
MTSTEMRVVATLAVLAGAVLAATGPATAADQLVAGRKLAVTDGARPSLAWTSKSTGIVPPPANGTDAPTLGGATLLVTNPETGELATVDLPAGGWSARAGGFRFRGTAGAAVKSAALVPGSLTVTTRTAVVSLNEASQGALGLVLATGGTRHCAHFGGTVVRDAPGRFAGKNAPAPGACPGGSASARAGVSTDVILVSEVDGAAIAFTVHEPTQFFDGRRHPLVLEGHGYGGNRVTAAERPAAGATSLVGRLLDAGYGIVSIDQRGHGESGGKIRILDPNFEGKDLVQILDWAEANLAWLAYRGGNVLLGAIGGSYGGGYQHTIYAHDPRRRLDAIAPEITWHDLRWSLFSGGVFKSFWAVTLSAAGNATPGGQDQEVNDGLVTGLTQNTLTPHQQDLLAQVSLVSACNAGTLPKIDALYWQSTTDSLFNMNDAVRNVACVRALGGDVRFLTKNGGHDSLLGGATGEQCGALGKVQSIVDWYDEKLRGMAGRASYVPRHCFHMDGSTNDGVVTTALPVGGQTFAAPPATIIAQDASMQVASLLLTTVGPGGAVLAGVPTIHLAVTDPLGLGNGDPILFLGLAKRAPGAVTDTPIHVHQVRPFRGYGTFDEELIGVTTRLAPGDQVRLLVRAAYVPRYVGSGSDVAAPVGVSATVALPLLPANLPAPPAN